MLRYIILTLIFFTAIEAQQFSIKNFSLSSSDMINIQSDEVNGLNPALPNFNQNGNYYISFIPVALNNSFLMDYKEKQFDNAELMLTKKTINDMINMADYGWKWREKYRASIFSMGFYNQSISISTNSMATLNLPVDLLKVLRGYDYNKEYGFNDFGLEILHYISFEYSYSFDLSTLFDPQKIGLNRASLGIGARVLYSPRYYSAESLSGSLTINDENSSNPGTINLDTQVEIFNSFGGIGKGFDFGFAGEVNESFKIGASLTNLFASIYFNTDNKTRRHGLIVNDYLDYTEFDSDSIITSTEIDEKVKEDKRTVSLPVKFSLAFSYDYITENNCFTITSSYIQGFEDRLDISSIPQINIGVEYSYIDHDWIKLRQGFSFGGNERTAFASGLNFNFSYYEIDLAVAYQLFGESSEFRTTGLSLSQKFKF
ncbi:MAG: hypothetical protein CR982_07025 [Candidatus Cloacimonadota bacterium]|nr:MAG: hypothetical protein CR982_07025 [Candidatus Cloacimonadota bacterium]PIE80649.1 MAG: hypothetical protein CSA15_01740 [Candidatus Delongbacteria bacterium]